MYAAGGGDASYVTNLTGETVYGVAGAGGGASGGGTTGEGEDAGGANGGNAHLHCQCHIHPGRFRRTVRSTADTVKRERFADRCRAMGDRPGHRDPARSDGDAANAARKADRCVSPTSR